MSDATARHPHAVALKERLLSLDILRGLCVIGMMMVDWPELADAARPVRPRPVDGCHASGVPPTVFPNRLVHDEGRRLQRFAVVYPLVAIGYLHLRPRDHLFRSWLPDDHASWVYSVVAIPLLSLLFRWFEERNWLIRV